MKNNFAKLTCCFLLISISFSCNRVADKAKEKIDSGAETVGRTTSDVVTSFGKGISDANKVTIALSAELKEKGLSFGKYYLSQNTLGKENTISIYFIADKNIDQPVHLKLFDKSGVEMGRLQQNIKLIQGTAAYYEFVFDAHVEFELKSKITID
ncbi:MAG: hypothetical protein PSV16_12190 [Flavobacterium sp.]|nr:hypothetical protein [Flavobacterium sp.]